MRPKPRCATCPHYNMQRAAKIEVCELLPPVFTGDVADPDTPFLDGSWWQPIIDPYRGCSYHPDFPAWLAEWRAAQSADSKPETSNPNPTPERVQP